MLASKQRPNNIDDLLLEKPLINLFKKIIDSKDKRSFIFFGTPGTGKTTISLILAKEISNNQYGVFNAATDSKQMLTTLIEKYSFIVIDEIHRLNKDKQDILLPSVENSALTIYATTTENPFFKVNPALRSRTNIIELKKPSTHALAQYLKNIVDSQNLFQYESNNIFDFFAKQANHDFRIAINNLDLISKIYTANNVTIEDLKIILPSTNIQIDQSGDDYYNLLSAFHKSMRGSDVDASLYYGFQLYKSEQFDSMFRRMICASYEDVGLAKPSVALDTVNAINAFERLGVAEGYLPIGFAIVNIALAPKSNSTFTATKKAINFIEAGNNYSVPLHLKDSHYASASKLKRGLGYKYPHDFENNWVKQKYLPEQCKNIWFYGEQINGYEYKIYEYWKKIKKGD
ncbi:AAA family ATPase [Mycoplasma phocoenae]|uniref:AAA family ATPase n=1 Tax=Mycoplasma phocoenae TaxID=754517 RepID=A0A858U532_9MOLU|nr:AAA family ATPase [Mycoplasma phocoenae]QJG67161.1 AAA family ATPase [Mycoplasma phocoenae]